MWTLLGITWLCLVLAFADDEEWQNHNCPAPRSPSNGISFIFQDGALVRYRCHPGFVMRGRAYARCIKNKWDSRTPVCIHRSDSRMQEFRSRTSYTTMPRGHHYTLDRPISTSRPLFDWEKTRHTPPYGDGPNRLPVINGIWQTSKRPSTHLFTIGNDNDAAKELIREEIGIAEVRQRQLEEVQRTRAGYKHIPQYRPVEDTKTSTKPRYHGSISVVVLPPHAPESLKLNSTTRRPKRRKGKKPKGKNRRGKNKDKFPAQEARHKPEGRVSTSPHGRNDPWGYGNHNSVHQRNSRPYKPSPSRPSRDQMIGDLSSSQYDDTCYEMIRGKKVPMRAPQVPNAFVYKYDSRKHYANPDKHYLIVHYNCRHGYTLYNKEANRLYCQNHQWVGETPLCEP